MKIIPKEALFRDDVWYAEVTPNDGTNEGTMVQSNEATVPSTYPEETEERPGIPGFPLAFFIGFAVLAIVFSIRKSKK